MNYATIATHFLPIVHYFAAFLFLFILMPKWLFPTRYTDWSDRLVSGYVKMVFLIIISGYLLVLTKLYEVISLIVLFLIIIGYRLVKRERGKKEGTLKSHFIKIVFNMFDGLSKFKPLDAKNIFQQKAFTLKILAQEKFRWVLFWEGLALIVILSISSYLRFYDAFVHAAPPMADSYVTLAWMKYIDGRELFHDGIYPQGFHIYLATLFKFAAEDALFILRYTGPLNAILFTIGLYVVIRKLTNTGIGALAAAAIFGVLWVIMPFDMDLNIRQAATNSQEFAFVFIFPALYFLIRFANEKQKKDLITGLICTAIIGLVHSLAFGLIGMLIGVLIVSYLLTMRAGWKTSMQIAIGAIVTVVISLMPLGAGYLFGKRFHSSSAEYLVDRKVSTFTYPELSYADYTVLGFCVLLFLCLFHKRKTDKERFIGLFTVLASLSVFILFYAGGTWTQSTLIDSRSRELWGLIMPFCVGMSISTIFGKVKGNWQSLVSIPLILAMFYLGFIQKPAPIIPYKLEHHENIEQYLRIRNEFVPKTWMIVSQAEGYSVSLGTGFHMHLGDFLQTYQPEGEGLIKREDGVADKNISPNIFIFIEKDIFQVSESNSVYVLLKPEYERRKREYQQLNDWMTIHEKAGNKVTTYFDNDSIRIYHLQVSTDYSSLLENIWDR